MQIYRQTAKTLNILLNRDERLVYSLCREETSDIVLAQRTQLPLDVLDETLSALLEHGLIEKVASSQEVASRSLDSPHDTPLPDKLSTTKAQLAAILEAELGEQAKKFLSEIESKQNLGELEEWSRKLVLKLRLTLSQKAANTLEARLQSLFT
jgi:hypothetical protein